MHLTGVNSIHQNEECGEQAFPVEKHRTLFLIEIDDVIPVKAVDGDRGVNNPVTYSISRGPEGVFAIDPSTGVVVTQQKLDREAPTANNGAYILEIQVSE